jgi:hypothetical protein
LVDGKDALLEVNTGLNGAEHLVRRTKMPSKRLNLSVSRAWTRLSASFRSFRKLTTITSWV